jgi:hypothetical protein
MLSLPVAFDFNWLGLVPGRVALHEFLQLEYSSYFVINLIGGLEVTRLKPHASTGNRTSRNRTAILASAKASYRGKPPPAEWQLGAATITHTKKTRLSHLYDVSIMIT